MQFLQTSVKRTPSIKQTLGKVQKGVRLIEVSLYSVCLFLSEFSIMTLSDVVRFILVFL